MLQDCCAPVVVLCATTETCEVPLGVGVGGGVLLLLQPSIKATEAKLSTKSGAIIEIFSRRLRRRRAKSKVNGRRDASVRENGWKCSGYVSVRPVITAPEVATVICVTETALDATLTLVGEKLQLAPEGRPVQ